MKSSWLKHGFWNTLEHAITRGSDALSSIVLLWAVSPETFAKLASSQALLAPLLLFFIAPETILYRDYSKWRAEGPSAIATRLSALRRFAWGKAQFALVLSAVLALFSSGPWADRFWPMVWAFSLALSPQISGPDREFLRLDLQLRTLNSLSLYQKLSLLIGTCAVAFVIPGRTDVLAGVAAFSALTTAWIAAATVKRTLRSEGASLDAIQGKAGPSVVATLTESLSRFSIWQHVIGVVFGWVQTMDLFVLSVFRYPGFEVGLYAAVLKISNFAMMLPLALTNVFAIWVGRRDGQQGRATEKRKLKILSLGLGVGTLAQCGVIYWMSPILFRLLSHGRWSAEVQLQMQSWLVWILGGVSIFSSTFLMGSWLNLRSRISELFFKVYLPWGIMSLAIYGGMIRFASGGPSGSVYETAARANVGVSLVYVILLLTYLRKTE